MEKISYRIQSKIKKSDGTPDFVMYGVTSDIQQTIKYHQSHLVWRIHPDPNLMAYSGRHGADCFEYIVDSPIIETATVKVKKERRKVG